VCSTHRSCLSGKFSNELERYGRYKLFFNWHLKDVISCKSGSWDIWTWRNWQRGQKYNRQKMHDPAEGWHLLARVMGHADMAKLAARTKVYQTKNAWPCWRMASSCSSPLTLRLSYCVWILEAVRCHRAEAGKGKLLNGIQEAESMEATDFLRRSEEGDLVLGLKHPGQEDSPWLNENYRNSS
jgi:hypothetical protein